MTTNITDYLNVRKKAAALGCSCPDQLGLLPINFESAASISELRQASEAATIRKLLLAESLPVGDFRDPNRKLPYIKNKSHDWVAPTLFVSASLYSQHPVLVSFAVNVLATCATDFFKGIAGKHQVHLDIVLERENQSYRKVSYEGPIAGLKELPKIVREMNDE
jgi:hypothetical protein